MWTDEELIRRSQKGDRNCLEILYLRYRDVVLRYAACVVSDPEDCQDILQETFKYVFTHLSTYEPRAKFTTFLYTITHHTALNLVSKRRKRFQLLKKHLEPQLSEASSHLNPQKQLIEKENTALLSQGIQELSPLHQQILHLRVVEELSYEEIAQILKIPLGTVKSRLHNSILQLRKILDQEQKD